MEKNRKDKKVIDYQRLEAALMRYGKETRVQTSGHFKLCCPWHQDNDPSCTVFVDRGIFYCFSCHADKEKGHRGVSLKKGLVALGVPLLEINKIQRSAAELELHSEEQFQLIAKVEPEEKKLVVVDRRGWPSNWSFRGIRPDFLSTFDANLTTLDHESLPRLELFLPNRGPAIYLRLASSVQPKTLNEYGLFTKASQPFGTLPSDWRLSKEAIGIILVEGAFDALMLAQHIHDHFGSKSKLPVVALLGSPGWTTFFKEKFLHNLLTQFSSRKPLKVFLALDPDDAGQKMADKIHSDLVTEGWYLQDKQVVRIRFPRGVDDPGALTFPQFQSALVPQLLKDKS